MYKLFIGGVFYSFFKSPDYFGLADRTVIGILLKHRIQPKIRFNPADRNGIGT